MSKESIEYLKHILLECDYIVSVIKPETSKDEFLKDETVKRAVWKKRSKNSIIGGANEPPPKRSPKIPPAKPNLSFRLSKLTKRSI